RVFAFERDAMVFEVELGAFHVDRYFGPSAVDFKLQRELQLAFAAAASEVDGEEQRGAVARCAALDAGRAHGKVGGRLGGIGEQMEADALLELLEAVAERFPTTVVGVPVA